ncbi:TPA: hypothetical protein ACGO0F_001166 [Streptococcus suis]
MKKKHFLLLLAAVIGLTTFSTVTAQAETTVYRLYNRLNGEHLYTTDANEKNVLFKNHGWGYEGEAWYAPDAGQGTPVYRLYNSGLQNHLYTTDTNEVKVLTSKHGWTIDNNGSPVFYSGGDAKIYRVYNRSLRGLHHWTTDTNEYSILPQHGWQQEGVKLKALRVGSPIQTQYYNVPQPDGALNTNVPAGSNTIANTESKHTIEAEVTLTGSGTGYHAKLVMATPDSAVSFGLQYDSAAVAPFTGKTAFLIENIASNNAGGQSYHRGNYYAKLNTTYRLMLTLQNDGTYAGYVNGTEVVRGRNAVLANRSDVYLRVEGAARKSGDSITATFADIKLKQNGQYNAGRIWTGTPRFNIANGILTRIDGQQVNNTPAYDRSVTNNIVFTGTLNGLPASADWDTAGYFDKVSGLIQFY